MSAITDTFRAIIRADGVLDAIKASIGEPSTPADWRRVMDALEDGEALAALGIDDQEAAEEAHYIARKRWCEAVLADVPGYAAQVWGGWVWIDDTGAEQRWSKRSTKEGCWRVVAETVDRIGIEAAFAP